MNNLKAITLWSPPLGNFASGMTDAGKEEDDGLVCLTDLALWKINPIIYQSD